MNIINEIGDTPKGQEMLGRTAERAYQRAQRTSGADKQRHEKTEWDAYQTAAGNSRKHLDGSGAHFARGRDAEYDEHWDDGRYPWSKKHKSKNESRNMNKKLIRLTENDLHKIVKESVNRILKEGFTKPSNWKDTPFKGTYEDENRALYMPDDDFGDEGFPYMIVTYNGEEEVNRDYVTLPRPGLHAYDDEVPFSLGSNQALIELD